MSQSDEMIAASNRTSDPKWTEKWKLTKEEKAESAKAYTEMADKCGNGKVVGGIAHFLIRGPLACRMFKLGYVMAMRKYKPVQTLPASE